MADGVFNIAKGKVAKIVEDNPTQLVVVLLKAAEADATLEDYDDMSALLVAAGNTEADFTNYARKVTTDTDGTLTVNDTDNRTEASMGAITWTSAGGTADNTMVKQIIAWQSSAGDANLVPLVHRDYTETTSGSDITINAGDFFRAS
jgi:hypothetical protein